MIIPMKWKWHLTTAAIRQYMELADLHGELEDDNPDFVQARDALGELSMTAKPGKCTSSGQIRFHGKVTINGKRQRIECVVMPIQRKEVGLPQLLRVTLRG